MIRWFLYLGLLLSTATVGADGQKRCLLVYSYHVGYPWNDAVDQGATEILQGECEIHRFYMDSKRNPDPQFIEKKARQAHAVIEQWKPDVVLAIDDNSSKYLVAPYLKDHAIPVVFAGVNWTVSEYGYPFSNVTGMIEVAPIAPLFLHAERILRSGSRQQLDVHVIDANRYSAYKEYDQIKSHFGGAEMQFHPHFVENFSEWKQAFVEAQQGDLVLLLNNAGIEEWSGEAAKTFVEQNGTTFSIAFHDWMKEFVLLTMAKEPQEQGEWAAEAAISILSGMDPTTIPIAYNRRWSSVINRALLQQSPAPLPKRLIQRSQWIGDEPIL